jgi:hypothetical protein
MRTMTYKWWGCTLEQEQSSHGNQIAPLKWCQWWHLLWNPSGNLWTEIMANQNTPVTGTVYPHLCPLPQFFCLLKPLAHVCTQRWLKMSWVLLLPLPTARPEPCNKPPFSAFTRSLYLALRDRWLDLAYGISGVWTLGPKHRFHQQLRCLWRLFPKLVFDFHVTKMAHFWVVFKNVSLLQHHKTDLLYFSSFKVLLSDPWKHRSILLSSRQSVITDWWFSLTFSIKWYTSKKHSDMSTYSLLG